MADLSRTTQSQTKFTVSKMSDDKKLLEEIEAAFHEAAQQHPGPGFTREELAKLNGMSEGRLSNLDSAGEGPPGTYYSGRKKMYLKGPGIEWSLNRVRIRCDAV